MSLVRFQSWPNFGQKFGQEKTPLEWGVFRNRNEGSGVSPRPSRTRPRRDGRFARPREGIPVLAKKFYFLGRESHLRGFRAGIESRPVEPGRDRRPGSKREALREGFRNRNEGSGASPRPSRTRPRRDTRFACPREGFQS